MTVFSALTTWPARGSESRYGRLELICCAVVVLIGALTRAYEIGYSLDVDEIFSLKLAAHPVADVVQQSLADRTHPLLHNLLLHFWTSVLGDSGTVGRAFSVGCAIGFMAAGYAVSRRLLGPALALAMLAVVAVSPYFVYYGQQARPYSLVAFLGALSLLLFARMAERTDLPWRQLPWFICSVLLINTHYIGALLIGSQVFVALFSLPSARWRIAGIGTLAVISVMPWMWLAFSAKVAAGDDPLDLISWMNLPTPEEFGWYFVGPFGENGFLSIRWLLLGMVLVLAAGLGRMLYRSRLNAAHALFVLLAFAVPVALFAIAIVGHKPIFADRQLIWALFALLVVLGFCLQELLGVAAAGVMTLLVVLTAMALPAGLPHNTKPPWGDIIAYLDAQHPGRPVSAFESWVSTPLGYYRAEPVVNRVSPDQDWRNLPPTLVLCRPRKCGKDVAETGREQKAWKWGLGTPSELRLYVTAGSSQ